MQRLLEGRVAIVTGGSRGIGRDICRVLGRYGARVAVVYAGNADLAARTVEEVAAEGTEGIALQADVRRLEDWERVVAATVERFGRLDGIVNNAIAGRQDGRLEEATDEDYRTALDYGVIAVVNSVRAARETFRAQGAGSVVNVVTEIWNMAPAGWSVYLAGKGAMVGVSRSLAAELGPEGIRVNMVAPGWMATDKVDTESEGSKGFAATLPLRRHGSGEEIGHACVLHLSDLGGYLTGTYLPVTGGRVTQAGV